MNRLSDILFNKFNTQIALYVGEGVPDEDIKNYYSLCDWDLVITSRTDFEFDKLWENPKRVCCSFGQAKPLPNLSKTEMPIIHLLGLNDNVNEDMRIAAKFFAGILRNFKNRKNLVVTGIDSDSKTDLELFNRDAVRDELDEIYPECISFWGNKSTVFKEKNNYRFNFYDSSLADIIRDYKEVFSEETDYGFLTDVEKDFYYRSKKPVPYDSADFLSLRGKATVLTNEKMHHCNPKASEVCTNHFRMFLETSSTAPVWEAYAPELKFYVTREYEDELLRYVRDALIGKEKQKTVVLRGAPGSSKSITLAAIAYKIYQEKKHPVIYITENIAESREYSDTLSSLKKLMEKLENKEENVLVVWDCSVFDEEHIKKLQEDLTNAGRHFVLLCCGYNNDALSRYKTFNASREFSEEEFKEFLSVCNRYSGISETTLKKATENERDVFILFYKVVYHIREKLALSLGNEHDVVNKYVLKKLKEITKSKNTWESSTNVLFNQLKELGLIDDDFIDENIQNKKAEDVENKLNEFNACVALFSQFGLLLPADAGHDIITKEENEEEKNSAVCYSSDKEALYSQVFGLPWLHYDEIRENFAFSFRIPLEAELFLKKTLKYSAEDQINLLLEIIDLYIKQHDEDDYKAKDEFFTYNLQKLIRFMGPNSNSIVCKNDFLWKPAVKKNLCEITKKISEIIKKIAFVDDDGAFSAIFITFVREYWQDVEEKNIFEADKELSAVIDTALEKVDEIENKLQGMDNYTKKHYIAQRNTLINEVIQCNTIKKERFKSTNTLAYSVVYNLARTVIDCDWTNGFAYNSLFKAFKAYMGDCRISNNSLDGQMMENLVKLSELINDCNLLGDEIVNRGSYCDELSSNITYINDQLNSVEVSLKLVKERTGENDCFLDLYDEMMDKKNPAAIIFVCRKELSEIMRSFDPDNKEHCDKIKEVYEFMTEGETYGCIKQAAYALDFLIHVSWIHFCQKPLDGYKKECQIIEITKENWDELYRYGKDYYDLNAETKRPIICLVYALATLHKDNFSHDAFKEAKKVLPSEEWIIGSARMRAPFILCYKKDEDKTEKTIKFSGTVLEINPRYSGIISINELPSNLRKVPFRIENLGETPKENQTLRNLELGIGYAGFSVYTEKGRSRKK